MFKKIILPLDLTEKHGPALNRAAELACLGNAEVLLLHVIELIPGLPREEEKDFYSRLEKAAREHLTRLEQNLAGKGVRCRKSILFGQRAREVVACAAEEKADLIILSAPPFDPGHPAAGWGSLSWKIGILAGCPVLLVK